MASISKCDSQSCLSRQLRPLSNTAVNSRRFLTDSPRLTAYNEVARVEDDRSPSSTHAQPEPLMTFLSARDRETRRQWIGHRQAPNSTTCSVERNGCPKTRLRREEKSVDVSAVATQATTKTGALTVHHVGLLPKSRQCGPGPSSPS